MIKNKIAVISGKGGVGKTTITVALAAGLRSKGYEVGILDADLTGSNIPDILGEQPVEIQYDLFIPPKTPDGIIYLSLGQIASKGDPIIWEGKDLASASKQLLERTEWGSLDYLIVDFPPGTESEIQSLLPMMDYALIVSVPSVLSESKVARMIEMCRETQTPVIGLIMNMTSFICECGHATRIFAEDHSFNDLGIKTIADLSIYPGGSIVHSPQEGFLIEAVLEAMKHPILLEKGHRTLRRILLELFIKKVSQP